MPDGLETAYVSQHVALARLQKKRLCPKWVGYAVLSTIGKAYFGAQGYGGTKIQLGLDDVAGIILTVPSLEEQKATIVCLEEELERFRRLVDEAVHVIDLLQERRSALISAAVTGKIDVRNAVPECVG